MILSPQSRSKSFHGWKILFLASLSQLVASGFTMSLLGLYIEPLSDSFSATPGQLGWASAIFIFVGSSLGPLLGHWVDKGKIRLIMTSGAALFALGFFLLSRSTELLHAALICGFLIAPGMAMLGYITANAMLVQWFDRRRGFAIGVAAAGISLGGFAVPPIAAWMITSYDWRVSVSVLGLFVAAVLLPVAWLFAVSKPSDLGQYPDGDAIPPITTSATVHIKAINLVELFKRYDFWIITVTIATVNFSAIMAVIYLVPALKERGVDTQFSALLLSLYAAAAFCGKFLAGWLSDILFPRRILTGITVLFGLGIFSFTQAEGSLNHGMCIAGMGLIAGGIMPVWASLVAVQFGSQSFGKVQGGMALMLTVTSAMPGPLGGYLYDVSGSYNTAFTLLIVVLSVGFVLSLFIPGPGEREPASTKSQ